MTGALFILDVSPFQSNLWIFNELCPSLNIYLPTSFLVIANNLAGKQLQPQFTFHKTSSVMSLPCSKSKKLTPSQTINNKLFSRHEWNWHLRRSAFGTKTLMPTYIELVVFWVLTTKTFSVGKTSCDNHFFMLGQQIERKILTDAILVHIFSCLKKLPMK